MQTITIGLDIAKSVFQVHGVDAAGNVIIRRKFKRRHAVASAQYSASLLICAKSGPIADTRLDPDISN